MLQTTSGEAVVERTLRELLTAPIDSTLIMFGAR
jgi:hypothetical protein